MNKSNVYRTTPVYKYCFTETYEASKPYESEIVWLDKKLWKNKNLDICV